MKEQEIKQKSIELIKKLGEKIDKCEWKKHPNSVNSMDFVLEFKNSGSVCISRDAISVYTAGGILVSDFKPTAENGNAYTLAILWSNVHKKIQEPIDAQFGLIITELDKL